MDISKKFMIQFQRNVPFLFADKKTVHINGTFTKLPFVATAKTLLGKFQWTFDAALPDHQVTPDVTTDSTKPVWKPKPLPVDKTTSAGCALASSALVLVSLFGLF